MKAYKKQLLITTLVSLLPMFVGILLWNQLPDRIPIHFDMNGVANGWAGKVGTVFGMPLFLTASHVLCVIFTLNDPKKQNIGKQMLLIIFWTIPVLNCFCYGSIYASVLGSSVNTADLVFLFVGLLFVLLGNYMTKNHQNYTVGIRLPWTLNSPENWNRTHRFASRLWIAAGIVIMLNCFFHFTWLLIAILVFTTVLPMIYSFILFKKGI